MANPSLATPYSYSREQDISRNSQFHHQPSFTTPLKNPPTPLKPDLSTPHPRESRQRDMPKIAHQTTAKGYSGNLFYYNLEETGATSRAQTLLLP